MPASIKEDLRQRATLIEGWLASCLSQTALPDGLRASMEYSLMAGGKRIRPVLCLASAELFGLQASAVLPFACAFECIHTYSLIHDDLPAMDNDDLRRGKPSNHKKFDEATAILAGDALLTDAFAFMATTPGVKAERVLAAIKEAAMAAGSSGMVGGQFLDMHYTGKKTVSLAELAAMHAMKTGALLTTPCVCGAILAGAEEKDVEAMRTFGQALGSAFQIADDILDVVGTEAELGKPVGSDQESDKVTYPSLLGLDASRQMAEEKMQHALAALAPYAGEQAMFLRELARYVVSRVS